MSQKSEEMLSAIELSKSQSTMLSFKDALDEASLRRLDSYSRVILASGSNRKKLTSGLLQKIQRQNNLSSWEQYQAFEASVKKLLGNPPDYFWNSNLFGGGSRLRAALESNKPSPSERLIDLDYSQIEFDASSVLDVLQKAIDGESWKVVATCLVFISAHLYDSDLQTAQLDALVPLLERLDCQQANDLMMSAYRLRHEIEQRQVRRYIDEYIAKLCTMDHHPNQLAYFFSKNMAALYLGLPLDQAVFKSTIVSEYETLPSKFESAYDAVKKQVNASDDRWHYQDELTDDRTKSHYDLEKFGVLSHPGAFGIKISDRQKRLIEIFRYECCLRILIEIHNPVYSREDLFTDKGILKPFSPVTGVIASCNQNLAKLSIHDIKGLCNETNPNTMMSHSVQARKILFHRNALMLAVLSSDLNLIAEAAAEAAKELRGAELIQILAVIDNIEQRLKNWRWEKHSSQAYHDSTPFPARLEFIRYLLTHPAESQQVLDCQKTKHEADQALYVLPNARKALTEAMSKLAQSPKRWLCEHSEQHGKAKEKKVESAVLSEKNFGTTPLSNKALNPVSKAFLASLSVEEHSKHCSEIASEIERKYTSIKDKPLLFLSSINQGQFKRALEAFLSKSSQQPSADFSIVFSECRQWYLETLVEKMLVLKKDFYLANQYGLNFEGSYEWLQRLAAVGGDIDTVYHDLETESSDAQTLAVQKLAGLYKSALPDNVALPDSFKIDELVDGSKLQIGYIF